jgi:hypothetical protein
VVVESHRVKTYLDERRELLVRIMIGSTGVGTGGSLSPVPFSDISLARRSSAGSMSTETSPCISPTKSRIVTECSSAHRYIVVRIGVFWRGPSHIIIAATPLYSLLECYLSFLHSGRRRGYRQTLPSQLVFGRRFVILGIALGSGP